MNYLKTKLMVLMLVLIGFLSGCRDHTSIDQSNQIYNYDCKCNETYLISTKIWVRNWYGFSEGLPYWETRTCGMYQLDSIMNVEYKKAEKEAERIEKCLEKINKQ